MPEIQVRRGVRKITVKVDKILSMFSEILNQEKKISQVQEQKTSMQMTSVIREAMQRVIELCCPIPDTLLLEMFAVPPDPGLILHLRAPSLRKVQLGSFDLDPYTCSNHYELVNSNTSLPAHLPFHRRSSSVVSSTLPY